MSDSTLWAAFRSPSPVDALRELVLQWKSAGVTQAAAEARLSDFLAVVSEDPLLDDDPIRDVFDFVVGFCSSQARLFS